MTLPTLCTPLCVPVVSTAAPPSAIEIRKVLAVSPAASTKYLSRILTPVGGVPVEVNFIASPATNPCPTSVISAGLATDIVHTVPTGVAVINSPGLNTVRSM